MPVVFTYPKKVFNFFLDKYVDFAIISVITDFTDNMVNPAHCKIVNSCLPMTISKKMGGVKLERNNYEKQQTNR